MKLTIAILLVAVFCMMTPAQGWWYKPCKKCMWGGMGGMGYGMGYGMGGMGYGMGYGMGGMGYGMGYGMGGMGYGMGYGMGGMGYGMGMGMGMGMLGKKY